MPIQPHVFVQNALAPRARPAEKKTIQKSSVCETEGALAAPGPKSSASSLARANAKMHAAIKKDDLSALKKALAEGADPTDRAGTKSSALNAAAQDASPKCLEELARALASNSALKMAVSACAAAFKSAAGNSPAHVKALLAVPSAWESQSPEKRREVIGRMEEQRFLDQNGGLDLLLEAIDVEKLKVKKEDWRQLAKTAILAGNEKALSAIGRKWPLPSLDKIPKGDDSVPFAHLAAKSGSVSCLRVLLNSGYDVNRKNSAGLTALWVTTESDKSPEFFKELLACSDLNARSRSNSTPLHAAASSGREDRVAALLKAGADANAQDNSGITPLMAAILSDSEEVVGMLGPVSDISIKQKQGLTAMALAIDTEMWECVEMMARGAGAKIAMQVALAIAKKYAPNLAEAAEAAAQQQELQVVVRDAEKTPSMKKDGAQEALPQRKTPRL